MDDSLDGESLDGEGEENPVRDEGAPAPKRRNKSGWRRLRGFLSPDSELRSSVWEAPSPCFHTIAAPEHAPESIPPGTAEAWLVPSFELAEILIARGASSGRVAVDRDGDSEAWLASLAEASPLGSLVPPQPFSFPWRMVVVLPTYDERDNIERMLVAIRRHLATDVLVVDDNSPDGTGELAEELARADEAIHVLRRPAKHGLSPAYIAGFRWALERGYERVFQMDCDFSHAPHDLPRLAAASGDAALVIGSRYVPGGSTARWVFRRRLLSRIANLYTRLFLGSGARDWTAGFRCFDAELLASLDLDTIAANGYSFQIEMTWRCRRQGTRIRELPVRFVDRSQGTSKMGLSIALEAIRLVPWLRISSLWQRR